MRESPAAAEVACSQGTLKKLNGERRSKSKRKHSINVGENRKEKLCKERDVRETLQLDAYHILLDGTLSEEEAKACPHVYRNVREALNCEELKNADREHPVTLYIAPGVYWIDDPDATDTLQKQGDDPVPIGMHVQCEFLKLQGLAEDAKDVVFAGNRGQSHGANGNYTMFLFQVGELMLSNLTIGNYCSVDLEYPKNPALNRAKRTATITQAQLGFHRGEKLFAKNCRFVSRLNLCPVGGAKRALYERCHFESTDDALNGNAVYIGCDFDFYGNRPFYMTHHTGAVFLDCLFKSKIRMGTETRQYFTKEGGPVTLVDCTFEREGEMAVPGWTKYPQTSLKCYQHNVTCNGRRVVLGGEIKTTAEVKADALGTEVFTEDVSNAETEGAVKGNVQPRETVVMTGKPLLDAYIFEHEGKRYYNTANLLGGLDNWDPLGCMAAAKAEEKTEIPTMLKLCTEGERLAYGAAGAQITGKLYCFWEEDSAYPEKADYNEGAASVLCADKNGGTCEYASVEDAGIRFYVSKEDEFYVRLVQTTPFSCSVENCYEGSEPRRVVVHGVTEQGLEAAAEIIVEPRPVEAPKLLGEPKLKKADGFVTIEYDFDKTDRADCSEITWYRCDNRAVPAAEKQCVDSDRDDSFGGNIVEENAVLTAVSGGGVPCRHYRLSQGDAQKYLMAVITPRVSGSFSGKPVRVILEERITARDIDFNRVYTDFSEMPTENRCKAAPGCFTLDSAKPCDIVPNSDSFGSWVTEETVDAWKYGETGNGSLGAGLYQNTQGARLRYTPVDLKSLTEAAVMWEGSDMSNGSGYGDMTLTVQVDPAKTAAQGFGSAGQYMDFGIKFDTTAITGFALRVIRKKEASDAVFMGLVEYRNGKSAPLTEFVATSCFLTGCTLQIRLTGNRLTATAKTATPQPEHKQSAGYVHEVKLEAQAEPNLFGGILIWHTGTPGTGGWQNTTMLHTLEIRYGNDEEKQ